jgi:hypothetical protein
VRHSIKGRTAIVSLVRPRLRDQTRTSYGATGQVRFKGCPCEKAVDKPCETCNPRTAEDASSKFTAGLLFPSSLLGRFCRCWTDVLTQGGGELHEYQVFHLHWQSTPVCGAAHVHGTCRCMLALSVAMRPSNSSWCLRACIHVYVCMSVSVCVVCVLRLCCEHPNLCHHSMMWRIGGKAGRKCQKNVARKNEWLQMLQRGAHCSYKMI